MNDDDSGRPSRNLPRLQARKSSAIEIGIDPDSDFDPDPEGFRQGSGTNGARISGIIENFKMFASPGVPLPQKTWSVGL